MKLNVVFKSLKEGMTDFGNTISTIINSILLLIVYIIGVGITSIIAKNIGKHFLDMKLSKTKKSYWEDINLTKKSIDNYYRQF